ncbi:hypothetical protein H8356DRAFT_922429, partial [Neocallimastix lanati (nom. inval.)]
YFLLAGRKKKFNNVRDKEWNEFCKCQLKSGSFTDIPLLVRTSTLLNKPIVSDRLRFLFNRFKKKKKTYPKK